MTSSHATILHPSRIVLTLSLLLLADLLFGLAHIAALPPWEGFDETGHFSSLHQLADTGVVPRVPSARMSHIVDDYAAAAPVAYASTAPFDANGGTTYRALFFDGTADDRSRARDAAHGRLSAPAQFTAGTNANHIAQHPPLFYALLTPLFNATRTESVAGQLFVLRAVSYVFAWSALVIGVVVAQKYLPAMRSRELAVMAAALWPLAVPSWFPAMARLGNDSLVALIVALLWWQLAARGGRTLVSAVSVGALLGAGALAKALMLPIAAGTIAWMIARDWRASAQARTGALLRASVAAAVALAICGWWYLGPSAVAMAGEEAVRMRELGGMTTALRANFSIAGYLAGVAAFLGMAVWSGTWSLARPPYLFFIPLMAAALLSAGVFLAVVRRHADWALWRLPLWWLAPVLAGFAYHILAHVALTGSGRGVGGYYLHVLVAPLAGMAGIVVAHAWQRARALVVSVYAYAVMFAMAVAWAQLLLFTGIFTKAANKYFVAPEPLPAWLGVPEALTRLATLAFPAVAVALLIGGGLSLALAIASTRARTNPSETIA